MADEQIQTQPKWGNCHVGKRAQRIERMRAKLWEWVDSKKGKADKDALIAMKMLMVLDGIGGPVVIPDQKGGKPPKKRQEPGIKIPALLGALDSAVNVKEGVQLRSA